MSALDQIKAQVEVDRHNRDASPTESEGAIKLVAALEAVLHLHQESDGDYRDFSDQLWQGKHCEACRDEWPCDTAEAITEALA